MAATSIRSSARIWVFTSNRTLTQTEAREISKLSNAFCIQWTAHKVALHAEAEVLHNTFLVISVDEEKHGASGCSIDAMHQFVRSLEKQFEIILFDRLRVVYMDESHSNNISLKEFENKFAQGEVNYSTLVFNTLISTGAELAQLFLIPLSDSWLANRLRM